MARAEKRYRGIFILTAFFRLISACFMAVFSFCLGKVVDVVINPSDSLQTTMLLCIGLILRGLCSMIIMSLYLTSRQAIWTPKQRTGYLI